MFLRIILIGVLLLNSLYDCSAQFLGGNKDGYASSDWMNTNSIFTGGNSDGHDVFESNNSFSIFAGGIKDGYHCQFLANPFSHYAGGNDDGYNFKTLVNFNSIFSGGQKDGYVMDSKILSFVWTGLIDTNWKNKNNWSGYRVPHIYSQVIIPEGRSNYPYLGPGLLSIGKDVNSGSFLCKNLWIKTNAELTGGSETCLEVYGIIEIEGQVSFKN